MDNIRNFCIIAHVDHGKSTLADRLLELTGTIEKRQMKEQYLDRLESERERGITIKMAPVRMIYHAETRNPKSEILNKSENQNLEFGASDLEFANSKQEYVLNLIDTPGHSDFSYEVSRALTAVEGAILLVDVTQGIQAQTLANFNAARKAGLAIIGAVNKVDINFPDLEEVINNTAELIGVDPSEILRVSGKTGVGVKELLDAVIKKIPAPSERYGKTDISRALVFDSFYHEHKGIVAGVRVFNGSFQKEELAFLNATQTQFKIKELGSFNPDLEESKAIGNGEIGYIATGLKDPALLKIGDTILTNDLRPITYDPSLVLPGYNEPQSVVFVSFYPEAADDYEELKNAFSKLRLNDSALKFEPDFNEFLGRGFKTGFLGKLHFEITAERLEKEFNLLTVHSFPSVGYKIKLRNGETAVITNPKDFPADYLEVWEPVAKVEIFVPAAQLGSVMQLQQVFRMSGLETRTLGKNIMVIASLPLSELVRDFDDQLKSISAGYASLSYEISGYQKTEVAKLEILVAGQEVGGLTRIVYKDDLEREGRNTVERLKTLLPPQQFAQALQASENGRIIARENIPAMKKDLGNFGKNGGDRTRKMKLWKKQQRGKEKLKDIASKSRIDVPASVFKELLKK